MAPFIAARAPLTAIMHLLGVNPSLLPDGVSPRQQGAHHELLLWDSRLCDLGISAAVLTDESHRARGETAFWKESCSSSAQTPRVAR